MKPIFITDAGKNLIAAAVGGEDPINFTRICTFDHNISDDTSEPEISQSTLISGIARNGNLCEVYGILDNSELREGYCIQGLGLFADGAEGEVLFGFCDEDSDAFYMPAGSENSRTEVTLRIALSADCSDNAVIRPNSDTYASAVQLREEIARLDGKLSKKPDTDHTHDERYYTQTQIDSKLSNKTDLNHTHDERYYTQTQIDSKLSNKTDLNHTHDERYYTETEIDTKLAGKAAAAHTHSAADILGLSDSIDSTDKIVALSTRVDVIETVLQSDITTNSVAVTFGNLNGIDFNGIWNNGLSRIEF